MTGSYSDELRQAYAYAGDEVIVHTLELSHSLLEGSAIRVAQYWASEAQLRDETRFQAKLETGEMAEFVNCWFGIELPGSEAGKPGVMRLEVSNVSPEIGGALRAAAYSSEPVRVCFREYFVEDAQTRGPHYVLSGLTLISSQISRLRVSGEAEFVDLRNKPFSTVVYDATVFPGLIR